MEIVKGDSVTPGARSYLIIGVEKSGKTTFIGSAAQVLKKALVFACEAGTLQRLGGLKNVDFVQAYVTKKDLDRAAQNPKVKNCSDPQKKVDMLKAAAEDFVWRRTQEAQTELLLNPNHGYELGAIDSSNYLQDLLLNRLETVNGKTGYDLWREAKKQTAQLVEQLIPAFDYFIVTVHVKTADDETVGKEMFAAALQGSYRDVIGGKFDAVFHSITKPTGQGTQYLLQALPDFMRKAGIRVPMGLEDRVKKEFPADFAKINELFKEAK